MNKQGPGEIGINNVDSNVFTQLKMMASIKYEGPRWPPVWLYQSCERQHNLPLPCAQLQTHYRQEAIVALPSPRTKQREEAEVTPSILPRLGKWLHLLMATETKEHAAWTLAQSRGEAVGGAKVEAVDP